MSTPHVSLKPFPSAQPDFVRLKDASVEYNVHPSLIWAEPIIAYAFAKYAKKVVVTSAKDGVHSEYSRHHWKPEDPRPSQAVDLRILDPATGAPWFGPSALAALAHELVEVLNFLALPAGKGHFTLLVEHDHFHLEWNPVGVAANVRGYVPRQEVYGL